MSKLYGEILHIYDPVFRQNFYYFISPLHQDYRDIIKSKFKIELPEKRNTSGGFNVIEKEGCQIGCIWTSNRLPDVIAHEIFHAVFWMMQHRGITLTDESEEVYAYYTQFLMKEINEYLFPKTNEKKK